MKRLLVLVPVLLILFFPKKAFAFNHQILNEVLGDSTSSALPVIPPTTEGPGLILPDSPLFFLDQLKQNIRLAFAFTPEEKAKIHEQIAGERLAELRFMLAKNNRKAVSVALQGVSENLRASAGDLTRAQFSGKDVKALAKEINQSIKDKQKTLDALENSSAGSVKLEAEQVQEDIFESKVEVEDALPDNEIENEVRDDLARRIERKVVNASQSARLLSKDLDELNKEASQSATKSLKRREEALKSAIEKSDEQLRKVQEKLLENEKKKQEALLKAQSVAAKEAQDALFRAQTAATEFKKAEQVVNEIRSNAAAPTTTSGSPGSGAPSSGTSTPSGSSGPSESGKSGGESESGSGKH